MIVKISWVLITFLIGNCLISNATPVRTQQKNVSQESSQGQLQILLPLYIYPNWYDKNKYLWKQVVLAGKKVPIVAIINPNSGPNNAPPNTDYQQGIKDLHRAGVKIVGYVPSNYGKRDIQAVKADIDIYTKYFKIDGIFIDETANIPEKLSYYQQLYQYIKSLSARVSTADSTSYQVIINPGVNLNQSYLNQRIADVIVTFENYHKNWNTYRPPVSNQNYLPQNFAALVHTTPNRKLMKSTLDRVVKYNFGYIYITNDSPNTANHNPWDTLPEYWQAEINYIQQMNSE